LLNHKIDVKSLLLLWPIPIAKFIAFN